MRPHTCMLAQMLTHIRPLTPPAATCPPPVPSLKKGRDRPLFRFPHPPSPGARAAPAHRHGLAAVQGVDGRLSLRVGGELHERTACSRRKRTGERQRGLSGQEGPQERGLGALNSRSASDTGGQKVRQSASHLLIRELDNGAQTVRAAHSQPASQGAGQPARRPSIPSGS